MQRYRLALLGATRRVVPSTLTYKCTSIATPVSKYVGFGGMPKQLAFPVLRHSRLIHTSQRLDVQPFLWLFLRPLAKTIAVLGGRRFRNWWLTLNTAQRENFWNRYGRLFYLIVLAALGVFGVHYYEHLQETPFTKRKRFIAFTDEQFSKIAEFEQVKVMEELHDRFLPAEHPLTQTVVNVMRKLTEANHDIEQMPKRWVVGVVNEPFNDNAFCLPSGHVIVFSGLMELIENEEQLAAVLAHELAHVVLGHSAEKVSFTQLVDYCVIVIMAAIWAVMPGDGIAIVTQWFFSKVMRIFVELPYSRTLEREADEVGLLLMAKACFDVREFARFWQLLHEKELLMLESNSDASLKGNRLLGDNLRTRFLGVFPSGNSETANASNTMPSRGPQKLADVAMVQTVQSSENVTRMTAVTSRRDLESRTRLTMRVQELLNTHPSHYHREAYLMEKMNDAIALRRSRKCCELNAADPRDRPIKTDSLRERVVSRRNSHDNLVVIDNGAGDAPKSS